MQKKILEALKAGSGYVSGEQLSALLKISRSAVWKHIDQLREQGYDILAVPHLGYQLKSSPDKLLPGEVREGLKTRIIGREIVYRESVMSTMDEAFALAVNGAAEGTVVCADVQGRGRGRMGRVWSSPQGKGVYLSVILRPQMPPSQVARLTLLSAVAACEAVNRVSGVGAGIKWPNDLLVRGRKLAGILTELNAEFDRVRFVVIGIGINVHGGRGHLPAVATSLKQELKRDVSRVEVAREVLRSLEQWYTRALKSGFPVVFERWKELSVTIGRRVSLRGPEGIREGEAVGLDEDGGLLVRLDSGETVKKISGDVVLI